MKKTMQRKASDMMLTGLEKSKANDDLVKNSLNSQTNNIKERIRQRSLASFNRSVNKASSSMFNIATTQGALTQKHNELTQVNNTNPNTGKIHPFFERFLTSE